MYRFGNSSLKRLNDDVHPDLVRVCHRALELSKYDFGILESKRSEEKQRENIEKGVSWSMNSKHLVQDDGYVHAIDFGVYVNGKLTWEEGYYRKVIQAFVTAVVELGVQVKFGGLFESVFDGPHVELVVK